MAKKVKPDKPKRAPKPPRKPLYAVGQVVHTKSAVRVPHKIMRRKWLFLIPGTAWVVTSVQHDGGRGNPNYRLKVGRFEIIRPEWRLKLAPAGQKGSGAA